MHFFVPKTSPPTASLSSSRRPSFDAGRLDVLQEAGTKRFRGRANLPQRLLSEEVPSPIHDHGLTFHQLLQDLAMEFTKLETKCAAYCAKEQQLRAELGRFRNDHEYEQTLKPSPVDAEANVLPPPPPEIDKVQDDSWLENEDYTHLNGKRKDRRICPKDPDDVWLEHQDYADVRECDDVKMEVADPDKSDGEYCKGSGPTPTTAGSDEKSSDSSSTAAQQAVQRKSTKSAYIDMQLVAVGAVRLSTWRFLSDPESSYPARIYSLVMNPFYVATMLVAMAQHTSPPMITEDMAKPFEMCFEIIFAFDIFIRFLVCPSKIAFVRNGFNSIDFLSAIPLLLRIIDSYTDLNNTEMQYILLCVVPILRLLKLQRRFEKFHLVYTAFLVSLEALPVLLYTLLVVILTFSTLIYVVESREVIASLPMAIWFVIVTVSTVGYGEIVPVSTLGKCITSVLIFLSMPLLAIPVGIVGNAFNRVWEDRNRLLLLKRTRVRLQQWGYDATHIPNLFALFGGNDVDEGLEFTQFLAMMTHMKLGMSDGEVWELFRSFDEDGGGTVDPQEFVQQIFPEDIVGMYTARFAAMDRQISPTSSDTRLSA